MKLAIGSDKSGFTLKCAIAEYLKQNNIEFVDLGTTNIDQPKPYFVVAPLVAPKVADGTFDKAILICGTGMGMNILSNKYEHVYAAACESVYAAKMARAINNANILCMGGWVIGAEMGIEMTKTFLNTEFLQDLEPWRQEFLGKAANTFKEIEAKIYEK